MKSMLEDMWGDDYAFENELLAEKWAMVDIGDGCLESAMCLGCGAEVDIEDCTCDEDSEGFFEDSYDDYPDDTEFLDTSFHDHEMDV